MVPVVAVHGAWLLGVPGQRVTATMASSARRSEDRRRVGGRGPVHPGAPDRDRAGAIGPPLARSRLVWKVLHN